MKIGITELIVIFVVALFVIGPDKLPAYAKKLGEALAQFKKYSGEATREIKESIVEPLEEAQRPLREAVEPLNEFDREIRGSVKDVKDSFAGIGKPKKEPQNTKASADRREEGGLAAEEATSDGGGEESAVDLSKGAVEEENTGNLFREAVGEENTGNLFREAVGEDISVDFPEEAVKAENTYGMNEKGELA